VTGSTVTNAELAEQFRRQADEAMTRRKILLCCHVALSTTASLAAAKRALREWGGPADIRDGAVTLLDELSEGR
jgi:2-methylcitrate dehydratase PrpD